MVTSENKNKYCENKFDLKVSNVLWRSNKKYADQFENIKLFWKKF